MKKIAIVSEGNGMRSVYSAGAIFGLSELHVKPDLMVASSGSSGTILYYAGSSYGAIKRVWTKALASKNFLNLWRFWKILDIDYLVDSIIKKQDPVNIKKVMNSKTKIFIGTTDYETGKPKYFCNKKGDNMYEAIRASKASPPVFLRKIKIKGRRYTDGQFTCSLERNIQKAIDEGATKIIAIKNYQRGKIDFLIWKTIGIFFHGAIKRAILNYPGDNFKHKSKRDISIFHVGPNKNLKMSSLSNKENDLRETFDLGYQDIIKNKGLKNFLK